MSPSPQKLSWSRLRRAHQLLLLVLIILIWAAVGLSAAQMLVYEMPARRASRNATTVRSSTAVVVAFGRSDRAENEEVATERAGIS